MQEHQHRAQGHDHGVAFESPEAAAFAELEAEVLSGLVDEAIAVLAEWCRREGVAVGRVIDLGCGPGVGTGRLAERFAEADVLAVDGSAAMLERLRARVERLGLGRRVEARQVELPGGFDRLGQADLVWASLVLHHVGDEVAALRQARGVLRPGGLLALIERPGPWRVLPEARDLGRPGIWARLDAARAAWFADMRAGLVGAVASAGYPEMLEAAGFDVLVDQELVLDFGPPLGAPARRLARDLVQRAQAQLARHADAADLEALGPLLDDEATSGLARRADARLRTSRHLYVARAPASG